MKHISALRRAALACLALAALDAAEPVRFTGVQVRQAKDDSFRRLMDRRAELVFDDARQRLAVNAKTGSLDVPYASVRKVILEISRHMRGSNEAATWTGLAAGAAVPGGGLAGTAIAAQHVTDYLCYFEVQEGDAPPYRYLIEAGKHAWEPVKKKLAAVFGDRVREQPTATGEPVDRGTLQDLRSKHTVAVEYEERELPAAQADKALVLVVARTPSARRSGKGTQIKLHANGRVVAVNRLGTWSYAYLEPGEYLLVSQADNANGMRLKLEAGQEYGFLQNVFFSPYKTRTSLSRHSSELVRFEAQGAYFSNWTRARP